MKFKKNQIKVNNTSNNNVICTLWNVLWPFELTIFKRRINVNLITGMLQNKDIIADWELYELILFNIL